MRAPPEPRTRLAATAGAFVVGFVVALVLAACGGSSSSSTSSTSSAQSAATATDTPAGSVTGRDGAFTTIIPPGFVNGAASLGNGPINLLYAALGPKSDAFRPNINVVRESSRGLTDPDTVAHREIVGLKAVAPQAHGFSALRTVNLDGAPGRSVDYLNGPIAGHEVHQLQVFAIHGNSIYTVTYTGLSSRYTATLPAMTQVLAAWRWK